MIRVLSLTTLLAAAIVVPALAQTTPTQPSTTPSVTLPAPSVNLPSASSSSSMMLTADEAKNWVGKPIYSSDDKKIGEVIAFDRGNDNAVKEMQAGIGGFLGMGETHVRVMPEQFKLLGDRVLLNLTSAQAKDLPKVVKQ